MTTGPRVGIVGGGQLARMTYQAAIALGVPVSVLAADASESAALAARDVLLGSPTDEVALRALARRCDVVTFDHELVDLDQVARLQEAGHVVHPSAETLRTATDKRRQRADLGAAGFPVPSWAPADDLAAVATFATDHGWPVVLKAVRGGYDGRGVWVVGSSTEADDILRSASMAGAALLVEAFVPLEAELAVLIARRPGGTSETYGPFETVQVDGICREVLAPAPLRFEEEARALGQAIAAHVGSVGILAVELFVHEGGLSVNELAARPHNSGHGTIEGAVTSQFENHLRAVLDLPLGATTPTAPAMATVNVLGATPAVDPATHRHAALEVDSAHVHLYAKAPRAGRKLGHVTVLGADRDEVRARARAAVDALGGAA